MNDMYKMRIATQDKVKLQKKINKLAEKRGQKAWSVVWDGIRLLETRMTKGIK